MIVFTVIGYLFVLSCAFWFGYCLAWYIDVRRALAKLAEPVDSSIHELRVLTSFLVFQAYKP